MTYISKIDKDAGLIRLTIGQVCSAGVIHNNYTNTDRKCYATPFMHTIWENGRLGFIDGKVKNIGLAIRISNDGTIIGNPSYRGNAIISFLDKKFEHYDVHSVKIIKVNKHSVNCEPVDFCDHPNLGKEFSDERD